MLTVDVKRVRGKMAECGFTKTSMSSACGITRNTLANYLLHPEKMPFWLIDRMAELLCDSPEEAVSIFFAAKLA